ncbi:MAG: hypothetical protein DMG53_03940 [Acidobacteria bacterium]|nr:MAG: hypothetical protein DMG53_03940 [Acidobacteriota bacterium]
MTLQGRQEQKKTNRPAPNALTKTKEEVLMKKRVFVMASLLVLSIMVAAQVVRAEESMFVNIPFAFTAGQVTLPAGEYRIQKFDSSSGVLLINCLDPSTPVMVLTFAAQANAPQSQSKLVFNRYDHRYFLSQVWRAGSIRGRQLSKSPREKELAHVARTETKGEITLVARLAPR